MTGSSDARRNAKAGCNIVAGIIGVNFSSGGEGMLGGFGVGPLELRRLRFGELSPLGDEDRLGDGDRVPGDPGKDGAQTICSGVADLILFSFS